MTKPRILYDLSFAVARMGFSGIPQDTRLLFNGLSGSNELDLCGLLRPLGDSFFKPPRLSHIENQALFIAGLQRGIDNRSYLERLFLRRARIISEAIRLYIRFPLLDKKLYKASPAINEMVWRLFFAHTVESKYFNQLRECQFYLSRIGGAQNAEAAIGYIKPPKINTQGWDFVFTQDTRLFRVSPGTTKVVRYHDGIPITAADTFDNMNGTRLHAKVLRKAQKDTLFVCNSPAAWSDLRAIAPGAEERATVIPYFIPPMSRVTTSIKGLRAIAEMRMSGSTIAPEHRKAALERWFDTTGEDRLQYVMSLATIEPRKNYQRLIEAWTLVRMKKRGLRLMIVGSPGWDFEPILARMRPYVADGTLLHLEKVAQSELPFLYSRADVFAFPSVVEGFGLPPTEAMQCGCPTVVSDVLAHRFMGGEAPLYCDPYDVKDIAQKLTLALDEETGLREEMVLKGRENVKRFSHEALLPEWEAFFQDNMPGKAKR